MKIYFEERKNCLSSKRQRNFYAAQQNTGC